MDQLFSKLERDPESHKGENGYVGVIAGSIDYTGAPALVAEAALRSGSDLSKILTSEYSMNVVAGFSENLIVKGYPSGFLDERAVEDALELLEWSDSAVIGPGLGDPDPEAVEEIVDGAETPLVIDADGIEPALEAGVGDAVFTPHSGEAEAIVERFGSIEDFVEEKSVVAVVKGSTDVVHSPGETFEVDKGTAAMTTGGTGDVLSGIIASLVSQGLELHDAARLGCWINGEAGERAAEEYGNGLVATDLVEKVPKTILERF